MTNTANPASASVVPGSRRGQALVETALLLPILLILLMGAIDFGRLFFSWVSLHQAARIAANHASIDPSTTADDLPTLISSELAAMSCAPGTPDLDYTRAGSPIANPETGDYAEVRLTCDFSLLTPLSGLIFGDPVPMQAVSSFPIRTGCLNCGTAPGGNPPPPPPEQCRTVPDMVNLSVAGARLAWESAGFLPSNVQVAAGQETSTVTAQSLTTTDTTCTSPQAIFSAAVTLVLASPDTEPPGCEVVPNVRGITVEEARTVWAATSFAGEALPLPPDDDPLAVVTSQATSQDGTPLTSVPGVSCLDPLAEPPIDLELETGPAWPTPPEAPCQVPHMIDKQRNAAQDEWNLAGFDPGSFSPQNGNFTVKWQALVGLTWVSCDASISVANQAP